MNFLARCSRVRSASGSASLRHPAIERHIPMPGICAPRRSRWHRCLVTLRRARRPRHRSMEAYAKPRATVVSSARDTSRHRPGPGIAELLRDRRRHGLVSPGTGRSAASRALPVGLARRRRTVDRRRPSWGCRASRSEQAFWLACEARNRDSLACPASLVSATSP